MNCRQSYCTSIQPEMSCKKARCVKSFRIRNFSGPYFPAFGLNMERYGTKKTSHLDTFPAVIGLIWNKSTTVTSFNYPLFTAGMFM